MDVVVQKSENAIKTLNLLSNLTISNIIDFLKENGPSSPSEIARKVNISPSTASRCLQELRKYNLVKARWKTTSIDERPLKIYTFVPNVLRFEYVLNKPKLEDIKPKNLVTFRGENICEFKDDKERGVYVSLESMPFRFGGLTADVIKEIEKNNYTFEELKNKFSEEAEEFTNAFRHLLTLGLITLKNPSVQS
jgi:predicted transcriptional regulator